MARKQIVQVSCDRCARIEEREEVEESTPRSMYDFRADILVPTEKDSAAMATVLFQDLCGPCYKTVHHHFDMIRRTLAGVSPDRKKQLKEGTFDD